MWSTRSRRRGATFRRAGFSTAGVKPTFVSPEPSRRWKPSATPRSSPRNSSREIVPLTVPAALEDVNFTLVLGAAMAMTVILLFLHNLRGTIIVSLAIPICVLATFLVMWAANFTLNQMTLLALSLSVGILVDDSIVV